MAKFILKYDPPNRFPQKISQFLVFKGALSLGGDILKNERLCFLREQLSNKKSLKNNFVYFDSTHSSGPFRMEISP